MRDGIETIAAVLLSCINNKREAFGTAIMASLLSTKSEEDDTK